MTTPLPQLTSRSSFKSRLITLCVICLWGMMTSCTPKFVRGTQLSYTPEREEVAMFIEKYRQALEKLDFDAIRDMASSNYYENASTTNDPSDDYDYNGLPKVLNLMRSVKAVKYSIKIQKIEILKESAAVDYEYSGQYMYSYNERDFWMTKADKNRITLSKDKLGHWKIVSGL